MMDAKPALLWPRAQGQQMWQAIEAVKSGAQACISAGNTGALMAMSVVLRTLPGIERPAIVAVWPTVRGRSVVDVGATIAGRHRNMHSLR